MLMKFLTTNREKYTVPQLEAEEMAPDSLCVTSDPTSDIEEVGQGDPWSF